jgi:NTP pyrophosphatase (non-canonical NTP hydrolase)
MTADYTPKIDPHGRLAQNFCDYFSDVAIAVGEVNVANKWDTSRAMMADPLGFDPQWVSTHKIAELGLIGTEVAEAIEEVRKGHAMDETYYVTPPVPPSFAVDFASGAEAQAAWEADRLHGNPFPPKPEGVPSELADVVIRAMDLADAYGIDLGAAIIEKLNHNATRGPKHGGKAL